MGYVPSTEIGADMRILNQVMFIMAIIVTGSSTLAKDSKSEKLAEVGTITNMQMGDAACYISFKDAKNKVRHADASHMICNDTSLLNRKATITYIKASIIAAHCEGDPACPDTETVWIVDSAELVAAKDLCQKGEVLYQGCDTTKGNVISFCTTEKSKNDFDKPPAYLVLRYGKPQKVAMEVISQPTTKIESRMARYAGGNTRLMFRWKHEGKDYLFESAYVEIARIHGMSTYQNDKRLSFEACRDHRPEENKLSEPHQYDGF